MPRDPDSACLSFLVTTAPVRIGQGILRSPRMESHQPHNAEKSLANYSSRL